MSNLKSNQYALALHTTTPQLGIAISNFAGESRSQVWDWGRDLSAYLHQCLPEILAPQTWQDLQFIAVAKGPGGFTGTRIGVVTARTLAQQLNISLFGISTLAAVAHSTQTHSELNSLIAVQMQARREQLFVAIYQSNAETGSYRVHLPETTMTLSAWRQTLASLEQSYQLVEAPDKLAGSVTSILELAYGEWQQGKQSQWTEVIPFYGQHPV